MSHVTTSCKLHAGCTRHWEVEITKGTDAEPVYSYELHDIYTTGKLAIAVNDMSDFVLPLSVAVEILHQSPSDMQSRGAWSGDLCQSERQEETLLVESRLLLQA